MLRRIRPSVILGRQPLARRQPCSRVSLDPMVRSILRARSAVNVSTVENMSTVIGKDGMETEIQVGQMRQTLGKSGFAWLFNKH